MFLSGSSPGDNAPVSQSNVAISVGVRSGGVRSVGAGGVSVHVDVHVPGVADALPSSATSGSAYGPIDVVTDALDDLEHLIDSFRVPRRRRSEGAGRTHHSGARRRGLSAGSCPPAPVETQAEACFARRRVEMRGDLWSRRCLERPWASPRVAAASASAEGTGGALSSIWASVAEQRLRARQRRHGGRRSRTGRSPC